MKAIKNGFEIEGTVQEIKLLLQGEITSEPTQTTRRKRKSNYWKEWNKLDHEYLMTQRALGRSYRSLSKKLNRTEASCMARFSKFRKKGL